MAIEVAKVINGYVVWNRDCRTSHISYDQMIAIENSQTDISGKIGQAVLDLEKKQLIEENAE